MAPQRLVAVVPKPTPATTTTPTNTKAIADPYTPALVPDPPTTPTLTTSNHPMSLHTAPRRPVAVAMKAMQATPTTLTNT